MKFKIEDVAFWIFLIGALAIIIWLLHGSPTLEQALVSLVVLLLSSEFLLWKKYYEVDKKSAVSFAIFKGDLIQIKNSIQEINQKQERFEIKIDEIRKRLS